MFAFFRSTNLQHLDLSSNKLVKIHPRSFMANPKLEILNLSSNAIHFDSNTQPIWDHLTNLKSLDLSHNNITLKEIPYQWKTLANNLVALNLSHNSIGPSLSDYDFDFKQTDIFVDLSHNALQAIEFEDKTSSIQGPDVQEEADNSRWRRALIELSYNPIDCTCQSYRLVQWLQRKRPYTGRRPKFALRADNLTCVTPEHLNSTPVREIGLETLSCPFPSSLISDSCPQPCTCRYIPATPGYKYDYFYRQCETS